MDYTGHFLREVTALAAAARVAAEAEAAPAVPSCPGWTVTDLVLHLGTVHRLVARIIAGRMQEPPQRGDRSWLDLAGEWAAWLPPGRAPQDAPVPAALVDWFRDGAADLHERFRAADPAEPVWTWSADHSVGFWQRMQAIEAAIHRWDAENAIASARPLDAALAADAVTQTFEIMAPMRRAVAQAPPGQGERYFFQRTDGPGTWTVHFDANAIDLAPSAPTSPTSAADATSATNCHIRISGTASDLALYLWQRADPARLTVQGDTSLLTRYFTLVPPL